MRRDIDHLKTLGVCHFIYAGLEMVGVAVGAFYIFLGVMILNAPPAGRPGTAPPPVGVIAWVFIGAGIFAAVASLVGATLTLLAGLDLRKQRRWTFTFVMAIVNAALGFPIGTVIGVFTIIVLSRRSVKALYAGERYVEERDDDTTRFRREDDWDEPPTRRADYRDDDRFRSG